MDSEAWSVKRTRLNNPGGDILKAMRATGQTGGKAIFAHRGKKKMTDWGKLAGPKKEKGEK